MTRIPVVLIDDDPDHLGLIARALRTKRPEASVAAGGGCEEEFEVHAYSDAAQAMAELPPEGPVVILCDYNMPGGTGLEWIPDFVKADLGPIILMTGEGSETIAAAAFRAGAFNYIVKGTMLEQPSLLHAAIHDALRRYRLDEQNRELARQLKALNRQLEVKNARLEQLTKTAQDFVDDVAHEFRTPLAVIKEFASIIDDGIGGPVTEQQHEHLGYIQGAAQDLAQMVDDFLDTGKMRAGTLRVDRRANTAGELFDAVRTVVTTRAARRRLEIVEEIEDSGAVFFADIEKVSRVLINLAINAVKFSPEGGALKLWAATNMDGFVEVGVTDEGPGLTPEDRETILGRFGQVQGRASASFKGFGLGLAIATDLLRISLGALHIRSNPGKGSTFSFTLPPAEPGRVLDAFLDAHSTDSSVVGVCAVHVAPKGHGVSAENVRAFFVSECRPTDLVLEADDGASLVLVGLSVNPDGWLNRLQTARAARFLDNPEASSVAFEARVLGAWGSLRDCDALRSAVTSRLEGVFTNA